VIFKIATPHAWDHPDLQDGEGSSPLEPFCESRHTQSSSKETWLIWRERLGVWMWGITLIRDLMKTNTELFTDKFQRVKATVLQQLGYTVSSRPACTYERWYRGLFGLDSFFGASCTSCSPRNSYKRRKMQRSNGEAPSETADQDPCERNNPGSWSNAGTTQNLAAS